jgi:HlyD family secretion protein
MKVRNSVLWTGIIVAAAAVAAVVLSITGAKGPLVSTAPVLRGGISREIITSGTLRPLTDVDVGTDVSGRIVKVNVDFNSRVHKGQVLAEIDPTPFRDDVEVQTASVKVAQAALDEAKADLEEAKRKSDRTRDQYDHQIASREAMETDRAAFDAAGDEVRKAEAALKSAQSRLAESRVNLSHTRIVSPIDGVVITRAVEAGQTVASRMQTPLLFEIADDLSRLVLECDVDEVDVGTVKVGETVVFTVPAYATTPFSGEISEIRDAAENVDGAVVYKTRIHVDNRDRRLLPGMTATVYVFTAALRDVLIIPNAAFKFHPPAEAVAPKAIAPRPDRKRGEAVVWVQAPGGKFEPRLIRRGITDLKNTAVLEGDLREGQLLAVGLAVAAKN